MRISRKTPAPALATAFQGGSLAAMLFVVPGTTGCGDDAASGSKNTPETCPAGATPGAVPEFPDGEPKCPKGGGNLLKLSGSLDGTVIDLERSGEKAYGGFVNNESGGGFQSPFVPDAAELFVGFSFSGPLSSGVVGDTRGGFIIVPTGTPGEGNWSITSGKLVFPAESSEGDVKFAISLVTGRDDCVRSAALRGCWVGPL
jgi:hypothetical protein